MLPAGSGVASGFSQTATGWMSRLTLSLITLFVATGMLALFTAIPGKQYHLRSLADDFLRRDEETTVIGFMRRCPSPPPFFPCCC